MMLITPDWLTSAKVHTRISTRLGGVSKFPYDCFNLGTHVGDTPEHVAQNRSLIRLHIPSDPIWLQQIHSTIVSTPAQRMQLEGGPVVADAAITDNPNEVLAILTADCLPVLFAARDGSIVGAAHAGWKGLCAGILENTVTEMLLARPHLKSSDFLAYLGPAIGPNFYEVGEDLYQSFAASSIGIKDGDFLEIPSKKGKYLANLYSLAINRLKALGIDQISGGQMCTFEESNLFYSYRRDGVTGRFASLIWIAQ
jgi:YfiH family protein